MILMKKNAGGQARAFSLGSKLLSITVVLSLALMAWDANSISAAFADEMYDDNWQEYSEDGEDWEFVEEDDEEDSDEESDEDDDDDSDDEDGENGAKHKKGGKKHKKGDAAEDSNDTEASENPSGEDSDSEDQAAEEDADPVATEEPVEEWFEEETPEMVPEEDYVESGEDIGEDTEEESFEDPYSEVSASVDDSAGQDSEDTDEPSEQDGNDGEDTTSDGEPNPSTGEDTGTESASQDEDEGVAEEAVPEPALQDEKDTDEDSASADAEDSVAGETQSDKQDSVEDDVDVLIAASVDSDDRGSDQAEESADDEDAMIASDTSGEGTDEEVVTQQVSTAKKPTVVVNYYSWDGKLIKSVESDDIEVYNANKAPKIKGATFLGWYEGVESSAKRVANDAAYQGSSKGSEYNVYAHYSTSYTVQHFLERLGKKSFVRKQSETIKNALLGSMVKATSKEFKGFTYDPKAKGTVNETRISRVGMVMKLYYQRNAYPVSYTYTGTVPEGATALPDKVVYQYGAPVDLSPDAQAEGYAFSGWDPSKKFTMPDHAVSIVGSFTAQPAPAAPSGEGSGSSIAPTTEQATGSYVDSYADNAPYANVAPAVYTEPLQVAAETPASAEDNEAASAPSVEKAAASAPESARASNANATTPAVPARTTTVATERTKPSQKTNESDEKATETEQAASSAASVAEEEQPAQTQPVAEVGEETSEEMGTWSPFNVAVTSFCAAGALFLAAGLFGRRRRNSRVESRSRDRRESSSRKGRDGSEPSYRVKPGITVYDARDSRARRSRTSRRPKPMLNLAGIALAAVAIVALVLTQDFAQPMTLFDQWSMLFAAMGAAQVAGVLAAAKG